MILPRRVLRVLCYNYFLFFDNKGPSFVNNSTAINEANLILKNLRIKVSRNKLSCDDFMYINPFINSKSKIKIKIEPYKNIPEDIILSLENILNKPDYVCTSCLMAPLFDCMGWILNNTSGKWKMSFIGSPTYDIWKTQMLEEEIDAWKEPDEVFDWWSNEGVDI